MHFQHSIAGLWTFGCATPRFWFFGVESWPKLIPRSWMRYLDCVSNDNSRSQMHANGISSKRWATTSTEMKIINASFNKCHATKHGKDNICTSPKKPEKPTTTTAGNGVVPATTTTINGNMMQRTVICLCGLKVQFLFICRFVFGCKACAFTIQLPSPYTFYTFSNSKCRRSMSMCHPSQVEWNGRAFDVSKYTEHTPHCNQMLGINFDAMHRRGMSKIRNEI